MSKAKTDRGEYTVTVARQIAGAWRAVGETVTLSPFVAKYYLPPLGNGLEVKAPTKSGRAASSQAGKA